MNDNEKTPTTSALGGYILRFVRWVMVNKCNHLFKCSDIYMTGIPLIEPPKTRGYDEWSKYLKEMYVEDGHIKRVACKCSKCGNLFYAHCGLSLPGSLY